MLSALFNARAGVSPKMASRFSKVFGRNTETFLVIPAARRNPPPRLQSASKIVGTAE